MNTDQEFEDVQRLLKLKRYEQPPPRYFKDFSGSVIARIKAGEQEAMDFAPSWADRLLSFFQSKAVVVGGVAAAACMLAVATTFMEPAHPRQEGFGLTAVQEGPAAISQPAFAENHSRLGTTPISPVSGSLTPAGTPTNSIFDMVRPTYQRVDWKIGGQR